LDEKQISRNEQDNKPKGGHYFPESDAEQFAVFLLEDDSWEPWKDLPTCNGQV